MFRHSYIHVNKRVTYSFSSRLERQTYRHPKLADDDGGLGKRSARGRVWPRSPSVTWVANGMRAVGDWKPPPWLKMEYIPDRRQFDLLATGQIDPGITTETWAPQCSPGWSTFYFPTMAYWSGLFQTHGLFSDRAYIVDQTSILEKSLGCDEYV